MTDAWPRGNGYLDDVEEKALDLRTIYSSAFMDSSKENVSTSSSSASASTIKSLSQLAPRLEVGCPVTGIPAAILAKCQFMKIPAVCLLGQSNPASAAELRAAVNALVSAITEISKRVLLKEEGGQDGLDQAVKKLAKASQIRVQATSSLYT